MSTAAFAYEEDVAVVAEVLYDDLESMVGVELTPSNWLLIDQERINEFAKITGDSQWIHVNPIRAAAEGPFGGTIAHGYLIQSLFPAFLWEIFDVTDAASILNYGINKLRFTGVVPVNSQVRLVGEITSVVESPKGGKDVIFKAVIEIEGSKRPALVADILFRYYK